MSAKTRIKKWSLTQSVHPPGRRHSGHDVIWPQRAAGVPVRINRITHTERVHGRPKGCQSRDPLSVLISWTGPLNLIKGTRTKPCGAATNKDSASTQQKRLHVVPSSTPREKTWHWNHSSHPPVLQWLQWYALNTVIHWAMLYIIIITYQCKWNTFNDL